MEVMLNFRKFRIIALIFMSLHPRFGSVEPPDHVVLLGWFLTDTETQVFGPTFVTVHVMSSGYEFDAMLKIDGPVREIDMCISSLCV